MLMEENKTK